MAIFTTKEIAKHRLDLCFTCEKITVTVPKRCVMCQCYMRAKVQLRRASCPLGKWAEAPLMASNTSNYAEYWREENEIIAVEMVGLPPEKAEYARSSQWPNKGKT